MRILALFAIVLAPMSMMGAPAAMAQPQPPASASHHEQSAAESGHCAEMRGEEDSGGSDPQQDCLSDCAVACAAISVLGAPLPEPHPLPAIRHPAPLAHWMRGLMAEAVDPPPRTA
ncbi:hypothetical protein E0504_11265 [Parafrankia sp. BMG5.11]|nr:hypothetical protein E0504_11265 [Parafrankia sp. BMG5.11]